MKKFLLFIALVGMGFASTQTTLKNKIQELINADVEIIKTLELESFDQAFFVIGKTAQAELIPLIASKSGEYFIGLSDLVYLSQNDTKRIKQALDEEGKKAQKTKNAALNEIFKSFTKDDFVFIQGKKPNAPTLIVVSDPDCPYCRQHLAQIENTLESNNVKFIFAPVHDERAFIKAQLIMNEAKGVSDSAKIIHILRKYYQQIDLSKAQQKTNYSQISRNTAKIFDSGWVRGVPFIFEEEK